VSTTYVLNQPRRGDRGIASGETRGNGQDPGVNHAGTKSAPKGATGAQPRVKPVETDRTPVSTTQALNQPRKG